MFSARVCCTSNISHGPHAIVHSGNRLLTIHDRQYSFAQRTKHLYSHDKNLSPCSFWVPQHHQWAAWQISKSTMFKNMGEASSKRFGTLPKPERCTVYQEHHWLTPTSLISSISLIMQQPTAKLPMIKHGNKILTKKCYQSQAISMIVSRRCHNIGTIMLLCWLNYNFIQSVTVKARRWT